MKNLCSILCLAGCLLVAGCSTPHSIAKMEGKGTRRVFDSSYDTIWGAAVAAAQIEDLTLVDANKATGFILVRRPMGVTTFGENVAIWVHGVGPQKTSVEVISRRTGPPVLDLDNWERVVLKTIAGVLPG